MQSITITFDGKTITLDAKSLEAMTTAKVPANQYRPDIVCTMNSLKTDSHAKNVEFVKDHHLSTTELKVCIFLYRYIGQSGDVDLMHYIADRYGSVIMANPSLHYDFNHSVVQTAVECGHLNILEILLNRFRLTIETIRRDDNSAIRKAAGRGHVDILQFLVKHFPVKIDDIRALDNHAFQWAAMNGHVNVLKFLTNTFMLNSEDARAQGNSALRWAVENGHNEVVRFLFDRFELLHNRTISGVDTAIQTAIKNGHIDILKTLVCRSSYTLKFVKANIDKIPLTVANVDDVKSLLNLI